MPDVGPYAVPMTSSQAADLSKMIKSHAEFSGIKIAVEQVSEGQASVTLTIPCEVTVDFFREFSNALNQESASVRGERVR